MKKLFAVVLLASAAYACGGGKKPSTTPDKPSDAATDGAFGGAKYGGKAAPSTPAPAAANPCAGK